jgi:ribosomal protein L21E
VFKLIKEKYMESKEIIAKMVSVYAEIEAHTERMKELKEEAKAINVDPSILATVAKAIFDGKSGKLRGKSEEILDILDKQGE